jgi:hypothetical protein
MDTDAQDNSEESLLEMRRKLYGVYDSTDDLRNALHTYQIVAGPPNGDASKQWTDEKSLPLSNETDATKSTTVASRATPPTNATNHSIHRDVWGKVPGKEAKEPIICPSCGRLFSTMRFALHLDKCMGLGATTRAATLQNQK